MLLLEAHRKIIYFSILCSQDEAIAHNLLQIILWYPWNNSGSKNKIGRSLNTIGVRTWERNLAKDRASWWTCTIYIEGMLHFIDFEICVHFTGKQTIYNWHLCALSSTASVCTNTNWTGLDASHMQSA